MSEKEVVFYDFCDTLVSFQTANAFVRFVLNKSNNSNNSIEFFRKFIIKCRLTRIINLFYKRISVNKALLLRQLKGQSYDTLNKMAYEFYTTEIKPRLIKPVINRLEKDIREHNIIIIISGGYDIYLKYFVKEFKISHLICSELRFQKDIFMGSLLDSDCMGKEKVKRIRAYSGLHLTDDFKKVCYSDSLSDLPLFEFCDERNLVIKRNQKINLQSFHKLSFNKIIID